MGIQNTIKQSILEDLIPQGVDRYVALFTIAPEPNDSGTELSGNGYARVAHQDWDIQIDGSAMYRINAGAAIEFPVATGDQIGIVAVGIFDAAVGGNLIWSMLTRNGDGIPIRYDVTTGDQARFVAGELKFGIGSE